MNLYHDFDNSIIIASRLFLYKLLSNTSIRKIFFSILIREIENKITIDKFIKINIIYKNIF